MMVVVVVVKTWRMRERHTCLEGGNYAASAAKSPSYPPPLSTSLSSNLSLLLAPTCSVGTLEGPEATAQGVGGHSIDFVQDSRRRQRRGQPDPPLVVPTRLQRYRETSWGCGPTLYTFRRFLYLLLSFSPSLFHLVPPTTPYLNCLSPFPIPLTTTTKTTKTTNICFLCFLCFVFHFSCFSNYTSFKTLRTY